MIINVYEQVTLGLLQCLNNNPWWFHITPVTPTNFRPDRNLRMKGARAIKANRSAGQ